MTKMVSVIIPCYNEVATIVGLLEAISGQTYSLSNLEVIIADGGSSDGTQAAIRDFARERPELKIKLIDNRNRTIPAALNSAIRSARGSIIVRLDAHSEPSPDYIKHCLETLERTGAANVGGMWHIRPGRDNWIGRSIAAAAAHPIGAGDASYRIGGPEGEVDTVPFGAYRKEWLERIGPFDEQLLTNEDYEYNLRIRQAGGVIWFSPEIESRYYARSDLVNLAQQYLRYGYWKARMLMKHPRSIRLRQAIPPLIALTFIGLLVASPSHVLAQVALATALGAYALTLGIASVGAVLQHKDLPMIFGVPLALFTMHFSWGIAFWWGLLSGLAGKFLGQQSN